MKRAFMALAVLSLLLGATGTADATEVGRSRPFGLGFVLGDPTGITGKYWFNTENALDFTVGFAGYGPRRYCWYDNNRRRCDRYGHISVNVDYLWHFDIVRGNPVTLDWYVGAGGRVWFWNDDYYDDRGVGLAARAPIGLALMFRNPSFLEVFFELVPSIYFWDPSFGFDAGLGVRFYF